MQVSLQGQVRCKLSIVAWVDAAPRPDEAPAANTTVLPDSSSKPSIKMSSIPQFVRSFFPSVAISLPWPSLRASSKFRGVETSILKFSAVDSYRSTITPSPPAFAERTFEPRTTERTTESSWEKSPMQTFSRAVE